MSLPKGRNAFGTFRAKGIKKAATCLASREASLNFKQLKYIFFIVYITCNITSKNKRTIPALDYMNSLKCCCISGTES